ncbi:MAG: hypothetical protein ABDH37_04615 [Candidatus Hydrothermales bacterium]
MTSNVEKQEELRKEIERLSNEIEDEFYVDYEGFRYKGKLFFLDFEFLKKYEYKIMGCIIENGKIYRLEICDDEAIEIYESGDLVDLDVKELLIEDSDIEGLSWTKLPKGLKELILLWCDSFKYCDISGLENLERLSIRGDYVLDKVYWKNEDGKELFPKSIKMLTFRECVFLDDYDLSGLENLEVVVFNRCGIENLDYRKLPRSIRLIDVSDCSYLREYDLSKLDNLEEVHLAATKIRKLEANKLPKSLKIIHVLGFVDISDVKEKMPWVDIKV